MSLNVVDLFYSVEGEGPCVGTPTIFVRLAGCSIKCKYCDTPESFNHTAGEIYTVNDLLVKIKNLQLTTGIKRISITGGNPMESDLEDLKNLTVKMWDSVNIEHPGIFINFEKEMGFFKCLTLKDSISFDIKTPCSGNLSKLDEFNEVLATFKGYQTLTYLKAVVKNFQDIDFLQNFMQDVVPFYNAFSIQPCEVNGKFVNINSQGLYDLLVKYNGRLIPQIHKCLGIQ